MKPTNNFRWLQFHVTQDIGQHPTARWYSESHGLLHVLQQWWDREDKDIEHHEDIGCFKNPSTGNYGKWRDVPIEEEK